MKIDPNAPAYPCPFEIRTPVDGHEGVVQVAPGWHPGMTIRLKLAESAMQARIRNFAGSDIEACPVETADAAIEYADELIKRANRDEPNG